MIRYDTIRYDKAFRHFDFISIDLKHRLAVSTVLFYFSQTAVSFTTSPQPATKRVLPTVPSDICDSKFQCRHFPQGLTVAANVHFLLSPSIQFLLQ